MIEKTTNRLAYLDGIRGLTALVVAMQHFKYAFYNASNNAPEFMAGVLELFFFRGGFCVKLFFVLSGFVLAYNAFNNPNFISKQLFKRYYRLSVPVLCTSLIFFLFVIYDLFYFDQINAVFKNEWAAAHWVQPYTFGEFMRLFVVDFMLFNDMKFVMNINSVLWTIPVELFWSYVLFLVFLVMNKIKALVWKYFVLFMYMALIFLVFKRVEEGLQFLGGALIALNIHWIKTFKNTKIIDGILVLITLILSYIIENKFIDNYETHYLTWPSVMTFVYLVLVVRLTYLQCIFNLPIFKWLGEISFSLYLVHLCVIGSISAKLFMVFPYLRDGKGLVILLVFSMALCLLIAQLFTKLIDKPLMKCFDDCYRFFKK